MEICHRASNNNIDFNIHLLYFFLQEGKYQAYALGEYTRKRYRNFLPLRYSEEDFYAYTTDVSRTHMSAQAYIAGLYPPTESEQWHSQLRWQPIPVHVLPNHILEVEKCPVYFDILSKTLNEYFDKFFSSNKDLLKYISKNSGVNATTVKNLVQLYDTLYIENIIGYPLPDWAESVLGGPVSELHNVVVGINGYSEALKRLGE